MLRTARPVAPLLLLVCMTAQSTSAAAPSTPDRPNIIHIMCDHPAGDVLDTSGVRRLAR